MAGLISPSNRIGLGGPTEAPEEGETNLLGSSNRLVTLEQIERGGLAGHRVVIAERGYLRIFSNS